VKTCWKSDGLPFGVTLQQRGRDSFRVVYGKQIKDGLTYAQAAGELGAAIMHALACDERLDNREKGELP
jgi:hypothetical protein